MLEGRSQRIAFTRRKILVQGEEEKKNGSGSVIEKVVKMGFFREADKVAGDILKDFRGAIIFLGRLLLLSTFVEDGFRMWHQWEGKFTSFYFLLY